VPRGLRKLESDAWLARVRRDRTVAVFFDVFVSAVARLSGEIVASTNLCTYPTCGEDYAAWVELYVSPPDVMSGVTKVEQAVSQLLDGEAEIGLPTALVPPAVVVEIRRHVPAIPGPAGPNAIISVFVSSTTSDPFATYDAVVRRPPFSELLGMPIMRWDIYAGDVPSSLDAVLVDQRSGDFWVYSSESGQEPIGRSSAFLPSAVFARAESDIPSESQEGSVSTDMLVSLSAQAAEALLQNTSLSTTSFENALRLQLDLDVAVTSISFDVSSPPRRLQTAGVVRVTFTVFFGKEETEVGAVHSQLQALGGGDFVQSLGRELHRAAPALFDEEDVVRSIAIERTSEVVVETTATSTVWAPVAATTTVRVSASAASAGREFPVVLLLGGLAVMALLAGVAVFAVWRRRAETKVQPAANGMATESGTARGDTKFESRGFATSFKRPSPPDLEPRAESSWSKFKVPGLFSPDQSPSQAAQRLFHRAQSFAFGDVWNQAKVWGSHFDRGPKLSGVWWGERLSGFQKPGCSGSDEKTAFPRQPETPYDPRSYDRAREHSAREATAKPSYRAGSSHPFPRAATTAETGFRKPSVNDQSSRSRRPQVPGLGPSLGRAHTDGLPGRASDPTVFVKKKIHLEQALPAALAEMGSLSTEQQGTRLCGTLSALLDADFKSMSITERKKRFKQLQAAWHPDKNPGVSDLSTTVFQFLQEKKSWFCG